MKYVSDFVMVKIIYNMRSRNNNILEDYSDFSCTSVLNLEMPVATPEAKILVQSPRFSISHLGTNTGIL